MIEFWRAGGIENTATPEMARRIEREGWDGQMFMDSQCLTADPYARMAVWATATERLKLCTGVTNSLTRHVSVTAAAAATIQSISAGRAVLGIGRGDSALAYLGYAPAQLSAFRQTLLDLQALLNGSQVAFGSDRSLVHAKSLASLSMGERPTTSALKWLPRDMLKVPLDVAATGPKVIEMSAPIAERLTFSVGAMPERLQWAMDLADAARRRKGLSGDAISYGAQIVLICHTDPDAMRTLANAFVPPLARFQVIQGRVAGPVNASDVANYEAVSHGYDMTKHDDPHANDKVIGGSLTWDFLERFAVVGPPERCIERLLQLRSLGIRRFVVVGPGYYPEPTNDGRSLFATEVMPAVRAALQ
jgi:5,10-methylenetetrahydromethanopterin reductase